MLSNEINTTVTNKNSRIYDMLAGSGLLLSKNERVIVFSSITLLFLFLFWPAFHAELYVVEDHFITKAPSWNSADVLSGVLDDIRQFQRFRPAYWVYLATGGRLFGANPHVWHASIILWGILTCQLLYLSLRRTGIDSGSSFIFVLFLVLSANQNWIWINLIPQETIGTLLTAISVWSIILAADGPRSRKWDILSLGAIAMAGLSKESFVILIPALLLLRLTCQKLFSGQSWRETLSNIRLSLCTGALIFAIELGIVGSIYLSKPEGYSGMVSGFSLSSMNPLRWINLFLALDLFKQALITFTIGVWLWLSLTLKKRDREYLIAISLIFVAWTFPQVLLYSNGLTQRYLFPAVIGLGAAIAIILSRLWRTRNLRPLWLIGVFLIVPLLVNGVKSTMNTVGWFTAETKSTHRMVEFLAQNVQANKTILMAGDPGIGYGFESFYSLPIYMKLAGGRSPVYAWQLISSGPRSPMHVEAARTMNFDYPKNLTPAEVGAIIVIDRGSLDFRPLSDWLGNTIWREISFVEPHYFFSIQGLKYVKAGEVAHKILLPHTPIVDGVPSGDHGAPSCRPLISIEPSLTNTLSISPFLDLPPWPLERDYTGGPGSILWLGRGDKEGVGWNLVSAKMQPARVVLDVVPGPGRPGSKRTAQLTVKNNAGESSERKTYESGQWTFSATLLPGNNYFRLSVLDEVTVPVQPNGDTRPLLSLLRHVTITEK